MDADSKFPIRVLVFCFVIVAICYANSITNGFILDDALIVAANPEIRTIQPLHTFTTPFWGEKSSEGIYRPLVILSYSLEYSLWHRWAPGFRAANLLLHAINGYLVFLLARSFLWASPAAWAVSAIYLIHPVHTEAVAGIAGRSELLSATFFFLAWLMFRKGRTGWCAAAFLLSLLSKENAISFPAVIALDIWITRGGFKEVRQEWKRLGSLVATAVLYLGLRLWVLGIDQLTPPEYLSGAWTLLQRELTSGRAFLQYFRLILAPVNVTGDYDFNSIPIANATDWDAWVGVLLIVATIVLAIRLVRRQPVIGFGILFFYLTMFPVSNWLIPTNAVMAERYLYVPLFGLALIAGMLWAKIPLRETRMWVIGGILAMSAILCVSHNYVWKDNYTFYKNMVRVFPNNIRGRQGFGVVLLDAGFVPEARAQFEAGLSVARNAPLLLGLAGVQIKTDHNCDRAHDSIEEALRMQPNNSSVHWLQAECFENEGNLTIASDTYRRAVEETQFPDALLLFNWGRLMERMGKQDEATALYKRAALIDSNNLSIKFKLRSLARE
jgi:hypothetical protein